jgi:hypothetical protein
MIFTFLYTGCETFFSCLVKPIYIQGWKDDLVLMGKKQYRIKMLYICIMTRDEIILKKITAAVFSIIPDAEIFLYGSRARKTAHEYSVGKYSGFKR